MKWIDDMTFERDGADGVQAVLPDGTVEHGIRFVQLFPLRHPKGFISVIRLKSGDRKQEELGILRDLSALPADQRHLVKEEIKRSFFLPEITAIRKVDSTSGVDEWHVVTDRGDKVLFICDRKQNIHVADDGMIFVTDMDKCRYRITRPQELDGLSQHLLERAMP